MRFLFAGAGLVALAAGIAFSREAPSTGELPATPGAPQPIGITAALLMDARYVDARSQATDELPLPTGGRGPLVAVGDANDAMRVSARYFVPSHTLYRSTPLTLAAPDLELQPREAWRRRDQIQIIDVREEAEFAASRIPGSERRSMFGKLHSTAGPVALFCLTGHRSAALVMRLREKGVRNVFSVRGGWLDWKHQRLPLDEKSGSNGAGGAT